MGSFPLNSSWKLNHMMTVNTKDHGGFKVKILRGYSIEQNKGKREGRSNKVSYMYFVEEDKLMLKNMYLLHT